MANITTSRQRACAGFFLAGALSLSGQGALSQALDDKYWIEASAYWADADTSVNVSRPGQPGTDIDLETDLDLDKRETLPAASAGARFGRFVVLGEYYAIDRSGSRTTSRDIIFDGVTYPANVMVNSKVESNVYRGTIGYTFLREPQWELGAAIGLHATDFGLELTGQARVGAGPGLTSLRRKRDFLAPQPTVGVYGTYEISPKVILNGRLDYLSLKVEDYDGGVFNGQASVAYRVNKTIQVGAAYRYVAYDLDVDKDTFSAKVDYNFSGPYVFLRLGFR